MLTTGAFAASALVAAWVALAVSITGSACDSDADSCYGVPSTGLGVPWQLITVLAVALCLLLVVLCVRAWRGLVAGGSTRGMLAGACGFGAVVAAWGYDRSNAYFDGGAPYRYGDPKWWVAALLIVPPALAAAALVATRSSTSARPFRRGS